MIHLDFSLNQRDFHSLFQIFGDLMKERVFEDNWKDRGEIACTDTLELLMFTLLLIMSVQAASFKVFNPKQGPFLLVKHGIPAHSIDFSPTLPVRAR